MIKDKKIFSLAIFILITQYLLGLPTFWKTLFITLSVFAILFLSVKIVIPKKATKPKTRKERVTPVFVDSAPIYPKDNTMESAGLNNSTNKSSI